MIAKRHPPPLCVHGGRGAPKMSMHSWGVSPQHFELRCDRKVLVSSLVTSLAHFNSCFYFEQFTLLELDLSSVVGFRF